MKKLLLLLFSTLLLTSFTAPACHDDGDDSEEIGLTAGRIRTKDLSEPYPTAPIRVPSASLSGHTFYINGSHPDYVLQLVDISDETVVFYETDMPAGTNSVVLPSAYTGTYIVQLLWGNWRFWGYIEL